MPDELSLRKCGVENGDRLKLVLGMRGGPINMRRVALPPSNQHKHVGQDLHHLMLKNKDQILEKMPKNGQVTVLLFREGDKVNVYHVLEKPDGSFSPISNDQSPLSSPEHQIHEDIAVGNGNGTKTVFGTGMTEVVIEVVVEVVADVDVAIIAISHSCLEFKIRYPEINI